MTDPALRARAFRAVIMRFHRRINLLGMKLTVVAFTTGPALPGASADCVRNNAVVRNTIKLDNVRNLSGPKAPRTVLRI